MSEATITYSSAMTEASRTDISEDVMRLAQQLSVKHGNVRITKEASGIHFYLASPICLKDYGQSELYKMHLAVNVDKWKAGTDVCGMCMKTNKPYSVSDLLRMKNLTSRGYDGAQHRIIIKKDDNNLEEDKNGNKIPKAPGECVPIIDLDASHPVIKYVKSRDYDPELLYEQFRASYCIRARDDYPVKRLPGGFYITPQCRLIFYIYVDGVRRGWQGRILDFAEGGKKHYYHPNYEKWVPMEEQNEYGKWVALGEVGEGWNPAKYIHAPGTDTTKALMGFDAAVKFNESNGTSVLGLTEGPLDSARLGLPFCAVMGKHFNLEKAKLLRRFDKVMLAIQNDAASKTLLDEVTSVLSIYGIPLEVIKPPTKYNDFGDMPSSVVDNTVRNKIRSFINAK